MKKLAVSVIIFLGYAVSINAQQTNPTPQSTPAPGWETQRNIRREAEKNWRFDAQRSRGNLNSPGTFEARNLFFQTIEPLYRKLTNEELELLAPNAEDLQKFSAFLRVPKTGITKLIADLGCADNPNVVVVTPDCLKYKMPGAGASFSFRTNSYRIRRLADLTFADGSFKATGIWLHGIFVDLGDVPLEKVTLNTNGVDFLNEIIPAKDVESAGQFEKKLVEGIKHKDFIYQNQIKAVENTTFVLRSIAYRGAFYRSIQSVTYNELDFDKREDVIVAFRIVRMDETYGSVTILWREISRRRPPELKVEKLDE